MRRDVDGGGNQPAIDFEQLRNFADKCYRLADSVFRLDTYPTVIEPGTLSRLLADYGYFGARVY